jgi:hypothetical protein
LNNHAEDEKLAISEVGIAVMNQVISLSVKLLQALRVLMLLFIASRALDGQFMCTTTL